MVRLSSASAISFQYTKNKGSGFFELLSKVGQLRSQGEKKNGESPFFRFFVDTFYLLKLRVVLYIFIQRHERKKIYIVLEFAKSSKPRMCSAKDLGSQSW